MTGMGCNGWEEMPADVEEIEHLSDIPEGYRLYNTRQRLERGVVQLQRCRLLIDQSKRKCA